MMLRVFQNLNTLRFFNGNDVILFNLLNLISYFNDYDILIWGGETNY